ncbi:MAG: oxygen-independent coproporphyrinogen III oxidase [Deltaproteobacteria bacterium]|nr:oxygen-independent coproporphyrinogen III oxidase [Deltaproteobacteria bacterium]
MRPDTALLKKYNVPGPRYTSYPTVPYWAVTPGETDWVRSIGEALDAGSRGGVGAALYVHIPFCQSLCTYCGCNTRITRNRKAGDPYIGTVLKEWGIYLDRLSAESGRAKEVTLTELHLGGGSPTFLSPDEFRRLVGGILERAGVSAGAEFSVEADPRLTTREQLKTLAELGFRRLSLGIQDFDPRVQEIVHRVQSEEQVRAVIEPARAEGFTSINFDLIYGLPLQTPKSISDTVDAVRRLRPDRIAFYAYAHVPWIKPGQRRFTEADLPVGDEKRALYELGRTMLEEVGYREIGMDHFALESDSLHRASTDGTLHRNFMGYTSRQVSPLIGLGVSSIGDSWGAFAQNEKVLETYVDRVERGALPVSRGHVLDGEDRILRRHILNLMTRFQTDWSAHEAYTPYLETVSERLAELSRDGLLELSRRSCRVRPEGRAFLRNVCMAFDARLTRKSPETQLFSKTI